MSTKQTGGVVTPPKALLFDWDGTLVDTHPVLAAAMNDTLQAFDMEPWTFDHWSAWLGQSAQDAFPELFGDDWERAKQIYFDSYEVNHLEKLELKSGASDLVQGLAEQPLYLGVVSNKTSKFLHRELDHLKWREHFSQVIGAGDSDKDKPAPDPIYKALEPGSHSAGPEVWMIGDNEVDIACGHSARCTTILVGDNPSEVVPDLHLPDLNALQELLLSTQERS